MEGVGWVLWWGIIELELNGHCASWLEYQDLLAQYPSRLLFPSVLLLLWAGTRILAPVAMLSVGGVWSASACWFYSIGFRFDSIRNAVLIQGFLFSFLSLPS